MHDRRGTTDIAHQLLYTPDQTADLLRVSRSKVYELLASGVLGSVRIGRARRVTRRQLDAFVEALEDIARPDGPSQTRDARP